MDTTPAAIPTLAEIEATKAQIDPFIIETPVVPWAGAELHDHLADGTQVLLKLELLQHTGTFKARGALANLLNLSDEEKARGVTAVSAGNHAIAVAFAASMAGVSAEVAMHQAANPWRVGLVRKFGGEVVQGKDVAEAFALYEAMVAEGRTSVHPFESKPTVLGTATVGFELAAQAPDLDAVIVPIGGGGLIAGIASAIKQRQPNCAVYGVEPEGARGISDSLKAGHALPKVTVDTIADSLGPPTQLPMTFGIIRELVDAVVTIPDQAMIDAMGRLFREQKLAVEPAGAASTAALLGPLKDKLAGKRVALIVCGANIDFATYSGLMAGAGA